MSHFAVLTHVDEYNSVDDIMEPYSEQTEDPRYLEFKDCTEEVENEWKTGTYEAYQLPDGTYAHTFSSTITEEQKNTLPIVKDCPTHKLYKTIDEYAEEYYGYHKNEDGKYGYYYNPNAFYDWYDEGGRFKGGFLVKCSDECSGSSELDGYEWVSEAKKSEICWDKMLEICKKEAKESYKLYQSILSSGDTKDYPLMKINGNTLYQWGDMLSVKNEPFEAYCERCGCGEDVKYAVSCYGFVDYAGYRSRGDMGWFGLSTNDKPQDAWNNELQKLIGDIPDDHILVILDCHI